MKKWMKHRNRQAKRQLIEHHDLIWRLGEFYTSEYVLHNQPWILEVPFHKFLERQLKGGNRRAS